MVGRAKAQRLERMIVKNDVKNNLVMMDYD